MRNGLLALAAVLALSSAASADLKLVQTTTMEGELGQKVQKSGDPKSPTVTLYYKGNRQRTESGDRVTIFDGQRMLVLNTKAKTYQVLPKDISGGAANPMMAMMDIKADIRVAPTGKTQIIQGKKATQYVMTMTMNLGMRPGSTKAPGSSQKAPPPGEMKIPPLTSKTELWTAEFPGVTLSAAMSRQSLPNGMGSMPFMKDMTDKMKAVKGIPLLTTTSQEIMGKHMDMTIKTTSLSEAPLPDSLFAPPAGFKQVPYEAPGLMMPGAGGGR